MPNNDKMTAKAAAIILNEVRRTPKVENRTIFISIEDEGENVNYFRRALKFYEVQKELKKRKVSVEFKILNPIRRTQEFMLRYLQEAEPETEVIIFPALPENADLYYKALALPETALEFKRRGVVPKIQVMRTGSEEDIVIATLDDVRNGKLD